jgi:hypothetical protein
MKRRLLLGVLVAMGFAGCATGAIVIAADGYPATYIRCNGQRMDRCYVKADRLCPFGYYMVAPPGYGALMIRCH